MRKTILFLIFILSVQSQVTAFAKETGTEQIITTSLPQTLQSLKKSVKQSANLEKEEQNKLSLQLDQAQNWMMANLHTQNALEQEQSYIDNLTRRKQTIETTLKTLKSKLVKTKSSTRLQSAEQLKDVLLVAERALDNANKNYLTWDAKLNNYQLLASDGAQQKLEIEKSIRSQSEYSQDNSSNNQPGLVNQVKDLSVKARNALLKTKLKLLQFQLTNLGALTQNAQTERDFWLKNKSLQLDLVNYLQNLQQTQQSQQAKAALEQSEKEKVDINSPLRPIYNKLINIQQQKAKLINQGKRIQQTINRVAEQINIMKSNYARDQQIIEFDGSKDMVASILHKRLETLTKKSIKTSNVLDIKDQLNEAVLQQIILTEELRDAGSQDSAETMSLGLPDSTQTDSKGLVQLEKQALQLHRQYIAAASELQSLYPNYISELSELNSVYIQQRQQVEKYKQFLHNHLLWLPNVNADSFVSIDGLTTSVNWLLNPSHYNALISDIKHAFSQQTQNVILWLFVLVLLTGLRKRFIQNLEKTASHIHSIRTDSFVYTLQAIVYTFALTLIMPLFFIGMAELLQTLQNPSEFTERLINSLFHIATFLFILGGLRHICRPNGLAEKHFNWSFISTKRIYQELYWAIPLGGFLILLVGLNTDSTGPSNRQLIGRIAFITLMLSMLLLFYRLWSAQSPILKAAKNHTSSKAWAQLHFLWFPLLLLIPSLLIWSTVSGYYYSSLLITERLNSTIGFILIVYMFRELLLRTLFLSERKRHYMERIKQREAEALQDTEHSSDPLDKVEQATTDELELNYDKLNNQVKQTVSLGYILVLIVGTWLLWSDILLALNLIDNSTLTLTKSELIDGVIQQTPLTLGDLLQGLGLGIVVLMLSKNLPGILEFMLLQYLPISNAARYAISSMTQYIIAIIGFVIIFRAFGIEWSNIQWLVAALSVGLGFGLQEIVANFVSGIILLFEQPIRVGDIVTVDGVTGKVSKIRIRATTIVNWDRQELVIPNKQIITGQLINWSLSDPVTRIKVNIGVAYGSDVNQAMQLMLEAAKEHPLVLKEPEASAIFELFGDNALQLSLRVFTSDPEARLTLISELNNRINTKFEEAGIVIAFPQRDIHLETDKPLEINLTRAPKPTQTANDIS